jgi:hypothetical protein
MRTRKEIEESAYQWVDIDDEDVRKEVEKLHVQESILEVLLDIRDLVSISSSKDG